MSGNHSGHREPTRFALSSLIDAMPDAIVIVNTEGQIVDANVQAVGMFGFARDELLGEPVEVLVPEAVRDRHVAERDGYVQRPRIRPMGSGVQLSAHHKDGHEFQVEINLAPYQSPEGLLVVGAIRDVAAQRRATPEGQ
jgi:PAS domain S-box-containing protein